MAIRPPLLLRPRRCLRLAITGVLAALTAACATAPKPQPVPVRIPVAVRPHRAVPAPPADWRDAPQTLGNWRWSAQSGNSQASFGMVGAPALVTLTCDLTRRAVLLARAGDATGAVPMTVRTTFNLRGLTSDPVSTHLGWITARLAARDPLLDAIVFSRGRFSLEVAGLAPLYLPSWPELSRVVEDCR